MSAAESTVLRHAQAEEDSGTDAALKARAKVMAMTQDAENAVLRPQDAGAWPHGLRAALAARIARLNGEAALAGEYAEIAEGSEHAPLCDPAANDDALAPVLTFMDMVATRPRDVRAEDIDRLRNEGIADADIVRLTELNAFLSYQIRLVAGLRLMREAGL